MSTSRGSIARAMNLAALLAIGLGPVSVTGQAAPSPTLSADQQLARDIYKELIEINSTTDAPGTTKAAEAMAARLRGAGFSEADVHVLSSGPTDGNLVARL